MKMAPVVYLAHSISAPIEAGFQAYQSHRALVELQGIELAKAGCIPIVPILLTGLDWRTAVDLDYALVSAADAIFVYNNSLWPSNNSKGVQQEIKWATEMGKPVAYTVIELLDKLADKATVDEDAMQAGIDSWQ